MLYAPTIALLYVMSLGLIAIAFLASLLGGRTPATRFPLCLSLLLIAALLAFTPLWLLASSPAARAAFDVQVRAPRAAREGRTKTPAPSERQGIGGGVPDADATRQLPISLRDRGAPAVPRETHPHHCQAPAVWAAWDDTVAQWPHDLELHGLHALWMGLCIKVERGAVSVADADTLFERARGTLVQQRRTSGPGE